MSGSKLKLGIGSRRGAGTSHPASTFFKPGKAGGNGAVADGIKRRPAAKKAGGKANVAKRGRRAEVEGPSGIYAALGLPDTDARVLQFLDTLRRSEDGGTSCTVGIPRIAEGSGVSPRQVQISVDRLIEAGYFKRAGYDFGNPDRSKRGATYTKFSKALNKKVKGGVR